MRTLCLLALTFTFIGAVRAQYPTPRIDEELVKLPQLYLPSVDLPQQGQFVITFYLCPPTAEDTRECQNRRSEWLRGKDEVGLVELTMRDLRNQKVGQVDYSLRARISAISARLARNSY